VPPGIYWDGTGAGLWYVRTPREDGGVSTTTVAQASARLSDLHAIAEQRAGRAVRGSVAEAIDLFFASLDFKDLADSTKNHYQDYAFAIKAYRLKNGTRLGEALVDRLTPGFMHRLTDVIAQGRPASDGTPAIPGYPTKANHWLRFLRRVFSWAREHDHIQTNPAAGVRQVKERVAHRMPTLETFRRVQAFARAAGSKGTREKGALPPYLWAAMEIAYQAILRGIEVLTLVESQATPEGLRTARRKGSRDNVVAWTPRLRGVWDAAIAYRNLIIARRRMPFPLHPERRRVFMAENGEPLRKSSLDSAMQRLVLGAIKDGIITAEQRFGLHDLKRKGITDTSGTKADKQDAAGLTEAMMPVYDFSVPLVKPSDTG